MYNQFGCLTREKGDFPLVWKYSPSTTFARKTEPARKLSANKKRNKEQLTVCTGQTYMCAYQEHVCIYMLSTF